MRLPDELQERTLPPPAPAGVDASTILAVRGALARELARLPEHASDAELTFTARRYLADARGHGVPLQSTLAMYRDVFAERFAGGNPIIARLRCERIVAYISAAYRWPG